MRGISPVGANAHYPARLQPDRADLAAELRQRVGCDLVTRPQCYDGAFRPGCDLGDAGVRAHLPNGSERDQVLDRCRLFAILRLELAAERRRPFSLTSRANRP